MMKTILFLYLFSLAVTGYTAFATRYFLKKMQALYDGDLKWWKNKCYELQSENENLRDQLHNSGEEWKSDK